MKLFRKKEEKKTCCGGNSAAEVMPNIEQASAEAEVKVLGSGCAKCMELENAVRAAISELGLELAINHVRDFAEIASYGVMSTPALVVNEKVVSCGRVLSVEEVKHLLQQGR